MKVLECYKQQLNFQLDLKIYIISFKRVTQQAHKCAKVPDNPVAGLVGA